ncbi:MAG: superoxide dismutase [Ginsengibacter sp.]
MINNKRRRDFLKNTLKGTLAITIGKSSIGSFIQTNPLPDKLFQLNYHTGFEQQPLPYAYNALENIIDATTMEIHYSKHAAAYSKNLQDAVVAEGGDSKSVEDILSSISKYTTKMRNNAGGHYNHEMFWQCMRPKQNDNKPTGKLLAAIEKSFSSFNDFKTQLANEGKNRFGSGWAWLYADKDKTLKVGSTPNQDNPLMDVSEIKGFPILGLDVWEHAYYLKYQNRRPEYIENWWNVVNWDYVQKRFEKWI